MNNVENPTLKEAATNFLISLPPGERQIKQTEVHKFARWCGLERPFDKLSPHDIANYVERLSLSDTDYSVKLEVVRSFLIHSRNEGWCKTNLSTHLKAKKPKKTRAQIRAAAVRNAPEAAALTRQRYAEMETERAGLKEKSTKLIEDIRKAAADKDFRENAPLAAAREQRGHIEGQIKELEELLKSATIIDNEQRNSLKVSAGDSVVLRDMNSGDEMRYILVSPREVDPTKGKISTASPLGKEIVGRRQGDIAEVSAPVGKLRYQIKQIEH